MTRDGAAHASHRKRRTQRRRGRSRAVRIASAVGRHLIPADLFYEWARDGKRKQLSFIAAKAEGLHAFAVLWERWWIHEGMGWLRRGRATPWRPTPSWRCSERGARAPEGALCRRRCRPGLQHPDRRPGLLPGEHWLLAREESPVPDPCSRQGEPREEPCHEARSGRGHGTVH